MIDISLCHFLKVYAFNFSEFVFIIFIAVTDFTNDTTVEANAGSNITLNCNVFIDPKLEQFTIAISWSKNGSALISEEDGLLDYTIPYLSFREHSGNSISLQDSNKDGGQRCQISV